jgi:hypothetical protein
MQPVGFCLSAAHSLLKQSVLNGHLSYTATNFWSLGWPRRTDLTVNAAICIQVASLQVNVATCWDWSSRHIDACRASQGSLDTPSVRTPNKRATHKAAQILPRHSVYCYNHHTQTLPHLHFSPARCAHFIYCYNHHTLTHPQFSPARFCTVHMYIHFSFH